MGTICLSLAVVGPLCASDTALLPQPQKIRYGIGELRLKNLSICFGFSPAPEDRFAGDERAFQLSSPVKSAGSEQSSSSEHHAWTSVEYTGLPGLPSAQIMDAEHEYWRRLQTRLWDLIRPVRDGDTLPDLEQLRPRM